MDEKSGSTMRDAIGGHHGTVHNVELGHRGVKGAAFAFDGTSAYVLVPDSPSLDPGSGNFTFTAHVNLETWPATDSYDIAHKGTNAMQYWKLEIHQRGRPHCLFGGSEDVLEVGGRHDDRIPNIADGKWHTVSCQKLSDRISLIVDGRTYSTSGSVGSISNDLPLAVGAKVTESGNTDDFYQGYMDEVRIASG